MRWFFKKYRIAIVLAAIFAAAIFYFFLREEKKELEFARAERRDIIQEVGLTGRVKPASEVKLAFERSGKVAETRASIGKEVARGDVLLILENAGLAAEVLQAEANLDVERIKLDELKRGARPEEIAVSRAKFSGAESALLDAQNNLADKLRDSYTKSDDAVRNKTDQFFYDTRSAYPKLTSTLSVDASLRQNLESDRLVVEKLLKSWKLSLDALSLQGSLDAYLFEAKQNLSAISSFLDKAALAVNSASSNANLSQTTLDGWRADSASARANVNTAIFNLSSAEEKLRTAESNLLVAKRELELKESGASSEEILSEEAKVKSAKAAVDGKRAELAKTFLISPIAGIVSRQEGKVGEIVSANDAIVFVISTAKFEIESNVPEADMAKLKIGDTAKVTLDAYGSDVVFEAKVVSLEPAETIVEGVATYKTKFEFTNEDERIKSGMTADIDVLTAKREGVLAVPARTIITRDGEKFLKVADGDEIKEIKITAGLRGSDGNVEILSGLSEGAKVLISP